MNTICTWLGERIDRSLHEAQLVALTTIMPKVYADMSLQGLSEEKLNLKSYQAIVNRLKMEEASTLAGASLDQPAPGSSIFNSSLLSSLTNSSNSSVSNSSSTPGAQSAAGAAQTSAPSSATSSSRKPSYHSQLSLGASRQLSGGQQQPQQAPLDSPSIQSRRFQPLAGGSSANSSPSALDNSGGGEASEPQENIADRALQSAARMFKGFWS